MNRLLRNLQELNRVTLWLLFINFTFYVGSFLVVPFIAIYLNKELGFSVAFVGIQLTIKLFSQRGLMMLGGIASDRVGATRVMGIGIVIRSLSFLLYMIGNDVVTISMASAAFGFGGALFIPSSKAALSAAANLSNTQLIFSLRSTANNLGMALGGLIGATLIDTNQYIFFSTAAAIQLSCGVLVFHPIVRRMHIDFILKKKEKVARKAIFTTVTSILSNRTVAMMALLYCAYMALCAQLEFTLPLAAATIFNNKAVGLMFFVNSLMVFTCQIPLNHFLSERISSGKILALGFLCIAISMIGFSLQLSLGAFLTLTAVFTIGEILIDPSIDAISSSLVDTEYLGTLFGIFGVFALAGGVFGNFIGSHFFQSPAGGPIWTICFLIAICATGLSLYQVRSQRQPVHVSEAPPASDGV